MKGNHVSISGNITRDAELRTTANGNNMLTWGICWDNSRKVGDGYESVPNFFDCKCWATENQLRVIQPLLVKGNKCAITEGHLVFDQWEKNGEKFRKVSISVDDPIGGMVIAQKHQTASNHVSAAEPSYDYQPSVYDEDIPF